MDLKFPSWEKPLREAQSESDLGKIVEKVHATEAAMFTRWQELASSSNEHVELEAMRQATDELLKIKREKLKWPDRGMCGQPGS